jgi:hypothetical protein
LYHFRRMPNSGCTGSRRKPPAVHRPGGIPGGAPM